MLLNPGFVFTNMVVLNPRFVFTNMLLPGPRFTSGRLHRPSRHNLDAGYIDHQETFQGNGKMVPGGSWRSLPATCDCSLAERP